MTSPRSRSLVSSRRSRAVYRAHLPRLPFEKDGYVSTISSRSVTTETSRVRRQSASPFQWSSVLMLVIIVLSGLLIRERSWSRASRIEMQGALDQVSRLVTENQFLLSQISSSYEKTMSVALGYTTPQREFILPQRLSQR